MSTHQRAYDAGIPEAAVCADCHGAHDIQPPTPPRSNLPKMCEQCHSEIYDAYADSVHGADLIGAGDPNVPTCTDCHGGHTLGGPASNPNFHLYSPSICEECHANDALMEQYGISTDVFESYISDFHGTTVTIFSKIAPDQETNKPVCIDCHGVHNMKRVDDPESQVMKDNVLTTCQKCHPDASENFPTSWLGHYRPDAEHNPMIYFVDLFYKVIIPVTVGGMLLFIATDVYRKIRTRKQDVQHG
jgi:hypothetical protein